MWLYNCVSLDAYVSLNKCKELSKVLIWQLWITMASAYLCSEHAITFSSSKQPAQGTCTVSYNAPMLWKYEGISEEGTVKTRFIIEFIIGRDYSVLVDIHSYIGWKCTLSACWSYDPLPSPLPLWHAAKAKAVTIILLCFSTTESCSCTVHKT